MRRRWLPPGVVGDADQYRRRVEQLEKQVKELQEQLNKAIDRIRDRYGFAAIQTGRTLRLRDIFPSSDGGDYTLPTPGLSR